MKRTIRMKESELRQMISESVKRILKESIENDLHRDANRYNAEFGWPSWYHGPELPDPETSTKEDEINYSWDASDDLDRVQRFNMDTAENTDKFFDEFSPSRKDFMNGDYDNDLRSLENQRFKDSLDSQWQNTKDMEKISKQAGSRPLHRKGSLNRAGLDENRIRKIVSNAMKRVINEGGHLYYKDEDGNVHTNSKETYRGVPGSTYIWHGEWADPEVIWDGVSLNCEDIEESLWCSYKDDCEENGQEPTNEGYEAWLEEMGTDYIASQLDDLVWAAQGCP